MYYDTPSKNCIIYPKWSGQQFKLVLLPPSISKDGRQHVSTSSVLHSNIYQQHRLFEFMIWSSLLIQRGGVCELYCSPPTGGVSLLNHSQWVRQKQQQWLNITFWDVCDVSLVLWSDVCCLFVSHVEAVFHEVSVYPKKELPFFILFTAGLCSFTAMLALLTHQFPELMGVFAKAVSAHTHTLFFFFLGKDKTHNFCMLPQDKSIIIN